MEEGSAEFQSNSNRDGVRVADDLRRLPERRTARRCLSRSTAEVLLEIGVDVSNQRSKPVDEFLDQEFDYLITVCDSARKECPTFAGDKRKLHWDVKDPAELEGAGVSSIDAFRAARDDLRRRSERFVANSV